MSSKEKLHKNELTGIIGKSSMDLLRNTVNADAWDEYRKSYKDASNLKGTSNFPVQLDIELNASCNLKCPMCPISSESPKGKGKSTWFDFNFYKEIIDFGSENGLCSLKLNYINEPLIRKDIDKFIKYAKDKKILDVYLSTNAVLMDERTCVKLIKSGLSRIQISIDSTSANVYDKVRPGGDFYLVLKNINTLIALKKKLKSVTPLIRVNFVRTDINEFQVEEFINTWSEKVDMVGIQEFIKPTKSNLKIKSNTSTSKRGKFKCSFPFKQLVITNEKKVLPCCTFWGEEMPLGELKNAKDLKKYWTGDQINKLREVHKDGKYHELEICRNCVEGGLVDE
jgi:radical SAM protein with 4Fe4S-binding SPASM domain